MTAGDEAKVFRTALVQAELTMPELLRSYVALGGTATADELTAYVEGRPDEQLDDVQHDTLVHALNERFSERDLDHPLPYHRS